MACIVYQTNKKTGVKYAYESVSYWDKEKNQPRSRRKYLGRVDPVTNEIIPSNGRNSHSEETDVSTDSGLERLHEEIAKKDGIIAELHEELKEQKKRNEELRKTIRKIQTLTNEVV